MPYIKSLGESNALDFFGQLHPYILTSLQPHISLKLTAFSYHITPCNMDLRRAWRRDLRRQPRRPPTPFPQIPWRLQHLQSLNSYPQLCRQILAFITKP